MNKLRDYQQDAANLLASKKRMLLCDEMGLGKTITALEAVRQIDHWPVWIVASRSAIGVWQDEAEKWLDKPAMIYEGTPKQREKKWELFEQMNLPFLISTFKMVKEILERQPMWPVVIADEVHRAGLLNRQTDTFKTFKKIRSQGLFLLTGTPFRQTPADLWGPLHLLAPRDFTSYWRFVQEYCVSTTNGYGKIIERRPKNPAEFRKTVYSRMIRRTKKEVLTELPELQRIPWRLRMTPRQQKAYDQIRSEMMLEVPEGVLITPNRLSQDTRLRQLLVCPKTIGVDDPGAALEALLEMVDDEFNSGNAVAIFSPYRQPVYEFERELKRLTPHTFTLTGDTKEPANEVAKRFQGTQGHRKIFLSTIDSGTAYTIHDASVGYMVGCDFDLNDNEQAEARIHRIGQTKAVRVYYFLHEGAIDNRVMNILDDKLVGKQWSL